MRFDAAHAVAMATDRNIIPTPESVAVVTGILAVPRINSTRPIKSIPFGGERCADGLVV